MTVVFGDSHAGLIERVYEARKKDVGKELSFKCTHGLNWLEFDVEEIDFGFRVKSAAATAVGMPPMDVRLLRGEGAHIFSSPFHVVELLAHFAWKRCCPWRIWDSKRSSYPVSDTVIQAWVDESLALRFDLLHRMKRKGFELCVINARSRSADCRRCLICLLTAFVKLTESQGDILLAGYKS